MQKRRKHSSSANPIRMAAILILMCAVSLAARSLHAAADDDALHSANDEDVRKVVAGFSNGWNTHDARAMCASLADDVEWTNWRGEVLHTRNEVEDEHAELFANLYKNIRRVDTVKSIRYLAPDLASVDNYWTMTGARRRDGSAWPYRAGYNNFLMAKRGGRWIVIISHTADFNAQAPPAN